MNLNFGNILNPFNKVLYPQGFFYALVGDKGMILTNILGPNVISRFYFAEPTQSNLEKIAGVLKRRPKAPLYIVACHSDQEFKLQNMPSINVMATGSLIQKRLEREFSYDALKRAMFQKYDDNNRKVLIYLFIACTFSEQLNKWYSALNSLTYRISSLLLLPLESTTLMKKLHEHYFVIPKNEAARIQILITEHKVSGIRITVFDNQQLFFTRVLKEETNQYHDVLAGNIQHEINATIEFLKRSGMDLGGDLDVIVIVEKPIKIKLRNHRLKVKSFTLLTPYEAAKSLGLDGAVKEEDRFSDLLITAAINTSRKTFPIHTREIVITKSLFQASTLLKYGARLLIVYTLIMLALNSFSYISNKNKY
ncbi:MAG: hypothetical protein AAF153_01395, partial [Pseudomonadota bacterium]